jgi:predicted alpha/beta hydrolase family esterase
VLVAPYYTDLGLESVRRSGWVTEPWEWLRIRSNTDRIAIFRSNNDPYISEDEFTALAQKLQADVHVFPGAGHFAEQDAFAELATYISRVYGG